MACLTSTYLQASAPAPANFQNYINPKDWMAPAPSNKPKLAAPTKKDKKPAKAGKAKAKAASSSQKDAKADKAAAKKAKDPNAPKRPMTAYFLWLNEERAGLKTKFPDLKLKELTAKAGEIWRGMSEDEKKVGLAEMFCSSA